MRDLFAPVLVLGVSDTRVESQQGPRGGVAINPQPQTGLPVADSGWTQAKSIPQLFVHSRREIRHRQTSDVSHVTLFDIPWRPANCSR